MARTGQSGTREEYEMRIEGRVSEDAKKIVSKIVDRVCIALDMSRSAVARLLTKDTPYPDKKLDSKIGGLINGKYTQIPWKSTIVEISSLIPSPLEPTKNLAPGELWEIFAELRDYRAEFIYPDDFEISTKDFDFAVQSFAAKMMHRRKAAIPAAQIDHVDIDLEIFNELISREMDDRGVSLEDFARSVGISPTIVKKILDGDPKASSRANFSRLAAHLINPTTGDRFENGESLIEYCAETA